MAMKSLIDGLDSDDPIIRQTSRHKLVQLAPKSVEPLLTLLRSLNRHLRWEAAKALASIADPSTVPALIRALEDSDGGVRWDAAVALVNIGEPSVEPILHAIIHRSKDGLILEGAQHVVHELSHLSWGSFLYPVYKAFEASHPEVSAPVAADAALMQWRSNRTAGQRSSAGKPALDTAASC